MSTTRSSGGSGRFRRYIAIPLAGAALGAIGMAAVMVVSRMTGYQGKFESRVRGLPFSEAWTDVHFLAGLIFVVTFVVLAVKERVRPWR